MAAGGTEKLKFSWTLRVNCFPYPALKWGTRQSNREQPQIPQHIQLCLKLSKKSTDTHQFKPKQELAAGGWLWVCGGCSRTVQTLLCLSYLLSFISFILVYYYAMVTDSLHSLRSPPKTTQYSPAAHGKKRHSNKQLCAQDDTAISNQGSVKNDWLVAQ